MPHLKLDQALVDEARALALHIGEPVIDFIHEHTTVAIERSTLRLIGIDGIDEEEVPLVNCIVDNAVSLLPGGILRPFVATALKNNLSPQSTAQAIGRKELILCEPHAEHDSLVAIDAEATRLVKEGVAHIRARKDERTAMIKELSNPQTPWLYVIVATGNMYEDIVQARAAARQGADVIAVIRSTAQSLLDYVPFGPTTEGFGGTNATQANFKLMTNFLQL
jgi:beta-lysine 5,6-aminomutase alpha subunit